MPRPKVSPPPSADCACPRKPEAAKLRLVYGLLSLRVPDDVQKPFRFCGAKFLRNYSRSGHNHVLGRLYYCVRAFV
jgi:hypothetical protein